MRGFKTDSTGRWSPVHAIHEEEAEGWFVPATVIIAFCFYVAWVLT